MAALDITNNTTIMGLDTDFVHIQDLEKTSADVTYDPSKIDIGIPLEP